MSVDQSALPASAPATAPDPSAPVAPDEVSGAKTVEEVEAYWRNRVSRKDSAHSAAENALRDELAALRRQATTAPASDGGQQGNQQGGADAELRRQIEETQRQLKAEQAARVIDQRKAKYPALAAAGTEDDVFATASEATLAKLNALADDEPKGTFIAPTGPKRGAPAQPKTYAEMSKQELLDEMKRTLGG